MNRISVLGLRPSYMQKSSNYYTLQYPLCGICTHCYTDGATSRWGTGIDVKPAYIRFRLPPYECERIASKASTTGTYVYGQDFLQWSFGRAGTQQPSNSSRGGSWGRFLPICGGKNQHSIALPNWYSEVLTSELHNGDPQTATGATRGNATSSFSITAKVIELRH